MLIEQFRDFHRWAKRGGERYVKLANILIEKNVPLLLEKGYSHVERDEFGRVPPHTLSLVRIEDEIRSSIDIIFDKRYDLEFQVIGIARRMNDQQCVGNAKIKSRKSGEFGPTFFRVWCYHPDKEGAVRRVAEKIARGIPPLIAYLNDGAKNPYIIEIPFDKPPAG